MKSFNRVSPLYPFPTILVTDNPIEPYKFQSGFSPLSFSNRCCCFLLEMWLKRFNRVSPLYPFPTWSTRKINRKSYQGFNRVSPLYPFPTSIVLSTQINIRGFNRVSPLYPFPTKKGGNKDGKERIMFQSGFSPLSFSNRSILVSAAGWR